jgi:hypothetical protein
MNDEGTLNSPFESPWHLTSVIHSLDHQKLKELAAEMVRGNQHRIQATAVLRGNRCPTLGCQLAFHAPAEAVSGSFPWAIARVPGTFAGESMGRLLIRLRNRDRGGLLGRPFRDWVKSLDANTTFGDNEPKPILEKCF